MMYSKCHLLEQNSLDEEMFCIWEIKEIKFKIYLAAKQHKNYTCSLVLLIVFTLCRLLSERP